MHVRGRVLVHFPLRLRRRLHLGVEPREPPRRKVRPVGGAEQRHQLLLLRGVVEDGDLGPARRAELRARRGVAHGDGDRALEHRERRARQPHAPPRQLPQRRRKALARREVGVVFPAPLDAREAVEEVLPRHARAAEPEGPVVDALQADLVPAVDDLDAGQAVAGPRPAVAQRHDERVHAVVRRRPPARARDLEAREDRGGLPVLGGVADPPLERAVVGRRHDPLVARDVEQGLGLQARHVAPVAQLGHREAAREPERVDVVVVPAAVLLGAQGEHGAPPERVLHAGLDGGREVDEREELAQEEVGDQVGLVEASGVVAGVEDGLEDAAHEVAVLLCASGFGGFGGLGVFF